MTGPTGHSRWSSLLLLVLAAVLAAGTARPAAGRSSYELEATYDVSLHLDWDSGRVHVRTRIDLRNDSGGRIDRVHLNTVVAKLGSMRKLKTTVDGDSLKPRVSGQTISLELATPLAAGATTTIRVAYRARLLSVNAGRNYFFSKLGGVAQLYRFIPWVSRRIPFGRQAHGEPLPHLPHRGVGSGAAHGGAGAHLDPRLPHCR